MQENESQAEILSRLSKLESQESQLGRLLNNNAQAFNTFLSYTDEGNKENSLAINNHNSTSSLS